MQWGSQVAAVEWGKAFKSSQKIERTEKGALTLENLYALNLLECELSSQQQLMLTSLAQTRYWRLQQADLRFRPNLLQQV